MLGVATTITEEVDVSWKVPFPSAEDIENEDAEDMLKQLQSRLSGRYLIECSPIIF